MLAVSRDNRYASPEFFFDHPKPPVDSPQSFPNFVKQMVLRKSFQQVSRLRTHHTLCIIRAPIFQGPNPFTAEDAEHAEKYKGKQEPYKPTRLKTL